MNTNVHTIIVEIDTLIYLIYCSAHNLRQFSFFPDFIRQLELAEMYKIPP